MEQTRISSSSSSQGTQPAHAARARPAGQAHNNGSSASSSEGVDPAGAGGFLALLAALGDGMAPLDDAPLDPTAAAGDRAADLLLPDAAPQVGVAGTATLPDTGAAQADAAALAAWQGLLAPGAQARTGVDTASLAQPDGVLGGGKAGAWAGALAGLDGSPQGLVAETAVLDTSGDLKGGAQPSPALGFGRAFSRMHGTALSQKAESTEALGGGRATLAADSGKVQLSSAQSFTATVATGLQAMGERGAGASAERSLFTAVPGTAGLETGALAADGLQAAAAAARGAESSGGRAGDGQQSAASSGSEGLSASGPQEQAPLDGAVFADPAQVQTGAEEQIADQVAYWVHQKTQNAELTLDRDGQPVQVSVSLSGNEAHVSFRSDQAQTRELLDRSMAQLSDLLRSEGLVLSGMSVGTSAGQGAGAGEQRGQQREGARQAQVVSAVPSGNVALQRAGGSVQRALDIFV